ncbi:glutamate synthase-related protein [Hamadaea tsunoensis]|uniref:glutamate synthase-related protein n=1 Tax=Hamadaea tsunoensis TaxID=53368 RepID=UPI0004161BCE|nr:glutamate synthase-related protein [Hamadaea tsunoensis]
MSVLRAATFAETDVRRRARLGAAAAFPDADGYGTALFGADPGRPAGDEIDTARLVPPVFMPQRLEKLIDLGREPLYGDVDLTTAIGGFTSPLPVYVSAFGSTQVASSNLGHAVSEQAGRLGVPMVIGENIVPMNGYGRIDADTERTLLGRLHRYAEHVPDGTGGVVVQQSTEDADAEVWNLVYSDPAATRLMDTGRLAFELKVGQGAKPGLGGMTVVSDEVGRQVSEQFAIDPIFGPDAGRVLRCGAPGTFTDEILRQQIRLMRNNFPRARIWVKVHPGRDIAQVTQVAWAAGADAVTVDGAEGGSGWAPLAFLNHVGLPLAECLRRIERPAAYCLLASGRMADGARIAKTLILGARAAGLGRAALIAADEDPRAGLTRLLDSIALELRLVISALGKYSPAALDADDIWLPQHPVTVAGRVPEGTNNHEYHH